MEQRTDVGVKVHEARTNTQAAAESVADLVHTLFLAGVGAAALAKDEMMALMDKLVERGRTAEGDYRKTVDAVAEGSMEQTEQAQGMVERRIETVLARMNVPTRTDISSLNAKITVLSTKIDAFLSEPETPPAPISPTLPADETQMPTEPPEL